MMPWFIWNGKNSLSDFGLWINKLPNRVRPEERHEEIEIPGRAGSLLMLEGEDVYSSYSAEMVVIARNTMPIDKIISWLRGSGWLTLSTDLDKIRLARIVGEVAFERIDNNLMQATIPFLFQPFRQSRYPDKDKKTIAAATTSTTIFNGGDVASKPLITISGGGNVTLTIGMMTMTFTSLPSEVKVDCDANVIIVPGHPDTLWTGSFTGDFLRIPRGEISITKSNNVSVTIDPRWRWL